MDKKTQTPVWDYKGVHLMDIDDDIIMKLQSDSIAVAVMGMQDGREKFAGRLKINNPDSELKNEDAGASFINKINPFSPKSANGSGFIEGETEIERLRRENRELLEKLEK